MIKKAALTLLILFFSLVTIIVTFVSKPEWFLAENIVKKAATSFLAKDDDLSWDGYDFSTDISDKGIKKLNLGFKNLCYTSQDLGLESICFESIHVVANIKMGFFATGDRFSFSKIELLGGTGKIKNVKSAKEKSDKKEDQLSLDEINEQVVSSLDLVQSYIKGSVKLELKKLNIRDEINLEANINNLDSVVVQFSDAQNLLPKGILELGLDLKEEESQLTLKANVILGEKKKVELNLQKKISNKYSLFETLTSNLIFKNESQDIALELNGFKDKVLAKNITMTEQGTFKVNAPLCEVIVNQENVFDLMKLSCDKFTAKLKVKNKIKKSFIVSGKVKIEAQNLKFDNSQVSAKLDVTSFLDIEKFNKVKLVIKDEFIFGTKKVKYPNFKLSLESQNIQDLYPYLKPYSLVPPAPFYDLKGKVEFMASNDSGHDVISFSLLTELSSVNQQMNVEATGKAYPNDKNVDAKVVFKDVKLVAPDISLIKKFSIIPSSTISKSKKVYKEKKKVESKDKSGDFKFKIKLLTSSPILIKNTITSKPVPISLDLVLTDKMKGSVSIDDYNLELFRRSAFVDYAKLLQDGKGNESVDAKIRIDHAQYKVYITIVGSPQNPNVIFDSVPPLSRENIISVLLYGQPLDEGNFNQTSSVANTSMALSDKLMGAASLFLFASTPINSVRYDPESESVRASFNLGNSTTLSVGSAGNNNTRDYSIQKKLGDNLYFDTELINDTLQDESYLVGMLKWIMRY